jgi:hypothetical protein
MTAATDRKQNPLSMDINRLDTPARALNWSALTILATIVVPLSLEWAFPSFINSHPEPPMPLVLIVGAIMCVGALAFYISLGQLAARLGSSWIIWVGLSVLTAPVGPIIAYIAMRTKVADARRVAKFADQEKPVD